MTLNLTKERNITQIQVSTGSKRHGNVPYVRIKIVASDSKSYKTNGKENAKYYSGGKDNEVIRTKCPTI